MTERLSVFELIFKGHTPLQKKKYNIYNSFQILLSNKRRLERSFYRHQIS